MRHRTATRTVNECLDPRDLTVFRDGSNNLCVRIRDRGQWEKVTVRLTFPYSDPDHYVALFHDGEEIGIVRDLGELREDSRALLRGELTKRYHVPRIERILAVQETSNAAVWTVLTDRGERELMVRDRHNFRHFRGGDVIIVDVDGNRFRIPRDTMFDRQSQRLLDNHG